MTLTFVNPHEAPDTLNILLYGQPKIGKTTAALSAPAPVLHLNAEGENAARFARRKHGDEKVHEVTVTGGTALNEVVLHLRAKPAEQSVVLDTVSAMFAVLLAERARGGKPTLPNYGDVTEALKRFYLNLRDLPVNVIVLAHEIPIKDESTGVIERLPYTGTNNPALGGWLMSQVDVIGYCGRIDSEQGTRFMATLVDAAGRRGGDRTDALGRARELDLSDWVTTAANGGRKEKAA